MSASSRARSNGRVLANPRAVSYDDDDRSSAPAAAFAPIDPQGPSEILSGRGLY
jgi:rare lipoprotein A